MEIRRLGPTDIEQVISASSLFDEPPLREWASYFLTHQGHHLLMAYVDDAVVGFVTGVEMTHPDKGTEMFLYELSVAEEHRLHGVGRALIASLRQLPRAAAMACGSELNPTTSPQSPHMWLTEPTNPNPPSP